LVKKEYDIIVYGATGFTGQLICKYLSEHKDIKNIKWGISGRDESKLKEISNHFLVDYIKADSFDISSLNNLTSLTKLIISTVGPYSLYGKKLVESCINNHCHYLDLTGEPDFVHFVENNFTIKAKEEGVILMNCCGFESIPPDIGVYYTLKQLKDKNPKINTFLKTKGKISGGTWASFLNSFSSKKPIIKQGLNKSKKTKKIFYVKELKKWALIFPVIDKHIVKKSAKTLNYGEDFSFNEYILFNSIFRIIGLIISISFIGLIAKIKFFRNYLKTFIPSGTGPTKKERLNHWFELKIFGNTKTENIVTTVSGGDPGYGETSKFISEMALCIILNYNQLNSNKGVITPAECSGELMIKRLKDAGIKFEHKITNLS